MKIKIFSLAMTLLLAGCGSHVNGSIPQTPASSHTLTIKPPGIEKMSSVNIHLTFPTSLKKPADLPADDVSILLPLYPGSQKTDHAIPNFTPSRPMTSYSYLGTQEELMPADTMTLEKWFDQSFATIGYQNAGKGQGGNFKTGEVNYSSAYISKTDRVELEFFPKGTHQTLVLYRVDYMPTPKRPADSILPSTINKIVITEGLGDIKGKTPRTVLVDSASEVSEWVSKINALQVDTVLERNCPMITYPVGYRLAFYEPNGTVIQATISGCTDLSINKTSLYENQGIADLIRNMFPRAN